MVELKNYEEAWRYVARIGFLPRPSPGWIPAAQKAMCDLENLIEYMGGSYPLKVHTKLFVSSGFRYPWISLLRVDGRNGKLEADLATWKGDRKPNINYSTISGIPEIDNNESFFNDEAEALVVKYLIKWQRTHQHEHVDIWDSKMGGTIDDADWNTRRVVETEVHYWS